MNEPHRSPVAERDDIYNVKFDVPMTVDRKINPASENEEGLGTVNIGDLANPVSSLLVKDYIAFMYRFSLFFFKNVWVLLDCKQKHE